MSAQAKYFEHALKKERSLIFDEEELEIVDQVKEALRKQGRLECWDKLSVDNRLNLIRGYWDRSHKVRDMTQAAIDIFDWRKENDLDNILQSRMPLHEEYHSCWPSYIAGEDKWGHWVVFDRVEELEVGALSKYDNDTVLRYRAQCLEALVRIREEITYRLGHRVNAYIYMIDLHGLSLKKHFTSKVRAILQPLFRISGDFYPDSLWNLFILNAPMSFRMVWRIINPWIDPIVKSKIRMLSGKSMYLPAMHKSGLPIESVPQILGGEAETTLLKNIVEAIIDSPDVPDHGFTTNQAKPDPEAQAQFGKDKEELSRRPSLMGRITKARNVKTFRRKTADPDGVDSVMDPQDGEEVLNEDEVIMKGWMSKAGGVNTSWKKRFFVLTPLGLYYFVEPPTMENHTPRGKIELNLVSSVRAHTENSDLSDGLFDIVTPRRIFQMRVDEGDQEVDLDTAGMTKQWMEEITSAAENDLCALDIEAVSKGSENHIQAGFLQKRGVFNRAWRKRYFVLTSHALYYYTDLPTNVGSLLKGRIDLWRIHATDLSTKNNKEFTITMPGRVFHLRAETEDDVDEWLSTVSTTVEKEQELRKKADAQSDFDPNGPAQPPMIRGVDEETQEMLGRTNSTMISGLTDLAGEFLAIAADMRILRKDQEQPPDTETMFADVRKRVLHMFKLF